MLLHSFSTSISEPESRKASEQSDEFYPVERLIEPRERSIVDMRSSTEKEEQNVIITRVGECMSSLWTAVLPPQQGSPVAPQLISTYFTVRYFWVSEGSCTPFTT